MRKTVSVQCRELFSAEGNLQEKEILRPLEKNTTGKKFTLGQLKNMLTSLVNQTAGVKALSLFFKDNTVCFEAYPRLNEFPDLKEHFEIEVRKYVNQIPAQKSLFVPVEPKATEVLPVGSNENKKQYADAVEITSPPVKNWIYVQQFSAPIPPIYQANSDAVTEEKNVSSSVIKWDYERNDTSLSLAEKSLSPPDAKATAVEIISPPVEAWIYVRQSSVPISPVYQANSDAVTEEKNVSSSVIKWDYERNDTSLFLAEKSLSPVDAKATFFIRSGGSKTSEETFVTGSKRPSFDSELYRELANEPPAKTHRV